MLKNISRSPKFLLFSIICLTFVLPGYLAVFAANGFSLLAADDPDALIKEAESLIKRSKESATRATTALDGIGKVKIELEKSKDFKKASADAVKTLDGLREYLEKNLDGALKSVADTIDEFTKQDKEYEPLIKRMNDLQKPDLLKTTIDNLNAQKKAAAEKNQELAKSRDGLIEPTNAVLKSADEMASDMININKDILGITDTVDDLLKSLPDKLPKLAAIYTNQEALSKLMMPLNKQLVKIVSKPSINPVNTLGTAKNGIDASLQKIEESVRMLSVDAATTNTALIDMRMTIDKNLKEKAVEAIKMLDGTEKKAADIKTVSTLAKAIYDLSKIENLKTALTKLDEGQKKMETYNELVRDGLTGDFNNFVNDFVPLFYFTDVPNLVRVLNPKAREIRDVSALREEAAAARRAVDRADLDLTEAQATVSGLQVRKRNLENELEDAKTQFESTSRLLDQTIRRVSRYGADDPTSRTAKERQADLEKQKTADETRYNQLKDEKTGLPAKIQEAETALLAAQKAVQKARSNVIMLVQDESLAFTEARDSETVYFAQNDPTSNDPIKQISIYAFGNRKIIYLRGEKRNVMRAKNIISFFDRPAPQARLALWTLDLNSKATKAGYEDFSDSLQIVDNQLANTRAQIAATLALLRRCINDEVQKVIDIQMNRIDAKFRSGAGNGDKTDMLRWARSHFYQEEILMRLGFDFEKPEIKTAQAKIVSRNMLPDPIGAGTLGEALIILSMAEPAYRQNVMKNFINNLPDEIEKVMIPLAKDKKNNVKNKVVIGADSFNLTLRALDVDLSGTNKIGTNTEFSPIQKEIVNSIVLASVPRLMRRLEQFNFGENKEVDLSAAKAIIGQPNTAQMKYLIREIGTVVDFLWYGYGISTTDLFGFDMTPNEAATKIVCDIYPEPTDSKTTDSKKSDSICGDQKPTSGTLLKGLKGALTQINEAKNVFRLANAQIAKTDNMVKQLIDAFDEDINRNIVMPTVYGLREDLGQKKVGVGIINRTSMLSTNRLVARVDARGSAQLALSEEQDALQAAQQLANLYLAAKTGGLLGGLGGLQNTQQRRETSEVYGINSGSVFKVTPVFDPSGQALRFQFDYTLANLVTEANGSVQPAMPRIERHTVNTEVQLSNLELREISRFESNAKLGIPTTYKGGIPIFRDIPYVNKVPLLGWFVRRSGKAAVIQESLILGQTTMYPTIADVFDLLSGDDYNAISGTSNKTDPEISKP